MQKWVVYGAGAVLLLGGTAAWMTAPEPSNDSTLKPEIHAEAAMASLPQGEAAYSLPGGEIRPDERRSQRAQMTPQEREARRFRRHDKDRNGLISEAEFLAPRQKAFARMDRDGDGRLDFREYAAAAAARFTKADRNRDGALTAVEFAATQARRGERNNGGKKSAASDKPGT